MRWKYGNSLMKFTGWDNYLAGLVDGSGLLLETDKIR